MKRRTRKLIRYVAAPIAAGLIVGGITSQLTINYIDYKLVRMVADKPPDNLAGVIAAISAIEKNAIAPYRKLELVASVATSQMEKAVENAEDPAGLDFTDEESQMLLKLAMAEAEDQGVIGKALVIRVVKNRVDSEAFPNSIEDVIYDPKQFSPVWDGRYDEAVPDAECYEALEMVLNYWDGTNGALYFESEGNTINWHKDNLTELFQFDDLIFYKQGD